jgi:hypothetical protein
LRRFSLFDIFSIVSCEFTDGGLDLILLQLVHPSISFLPYQCLIIVKRGLFVF